MTERVNSALREVKTMMLNEHDRDDLVSFVLKYALPNIDIVLAHTDTGIVWGKVLFSTDQAPRLALAGDAFPNPIQNQQHLVRQVQSRLQSSTLWQIRLFGTGGEYFVWRERSPNENDSAKVRFKMRAILDDWKEDSPYCLNDTQWLWGSLGQRGIAGDGFTLLFEGRQGLVHAPPITGLGPNERTALTVRHYIEYSSVGCATIVASRLTGLKRVE